MGAVWLLGAFACGRLGFGASVDAVAGDAAGSHDAFNADTPAGSDASSDAGAVACPTTGAPFPTITVSGTITIINDLGADGPGADVDVELLGSASGGVLAQTTSDGSGDFSLTAETNRQPIVTPLQLENAAYVTTVFQPDAPIGSDVDVGLDMATPDAIAALYNNAGVTPDASLGTVAVIVADCSGDLLSHVTVQLAPAPAAIAYATPSDTFDGGFNSTSSAGIAVALNVPVGTVTVTASASGRTFYPHDLDVAGGDDVIITDERSP
jgi:hypothetical protein